MTGHQVGRDEVVSMPRRQIVEILEESSKYRQQRLVLRIRDRVPTVEFVAVDRTYRLALFRSSWNREESAVETNGANLKCVRQW